MIFLLPGNEKYTLEKNLPLVALPKTFDEGQELNLEDFQWWSYSEDFQEWLKENPREWTAESLTNLEQGEIFERYPQFKRLKGFYDFISEADESGSSDSATEEAVKSLIKFNFAYHRLIADGKISDTLDASSLDPSIKYALFMTFSGEEGEGGIPGTLQAYRTSSVKIDSDKINILDIDYAVPYNGKIEPGEDLRSFVERALKNASAIAAGVGVSFGLYHAIAFVGGGIGARWILSKTVGKYLRGAASGTQQASRIARFKKYLKDTKIIKNAATGLVDVALLGNTRRGLSAAQRASRIKNIKPVGILRAFMRGSKLSNLFPKFMGSATRLGTKVGARLGAKAIPVVGEVLMVLDIGVSAWNWLRDSQAPTYNEVKSFAKGEFSPKDVKKGVPMTICWSQPSGSWANWVTTRETRTTMEMIKVYESDGKSVFIVVQANHKELGKILGDNALVMAVFDSGETVERGLLDNDDLEFSLITVESFDDIMGPFVFNGICPWDDFSNEFSEAPNYPLVANEDAPETFEFNFEDSKKDRINSSGTLLPTSMIKKLSEQDLENIFGYREDVDISESDNIDIKLTYSSFLNEAEGSSFDEAESEKLANPAGVAIYKVDAISYVDPSLASTRSIPEIKYFLVATESLNVPDGNSVLVLSSNDVEFTDSIKGLLEFSPEEEDENKKSGGQEDSEESEDVGDEKQRPEEEKDSEKDGLKTTNKDISYKERRGSISIRDRIVKDGVNVMKEFLTDDEINLLDIDSWKSITKITARKDKSKDVINKVVFRNNKAGAGDRVREYTKVDGESFEIAKRLIRDIKDNVNYE